MAQVRETFSLQITVDDFRATDEDLQAFARLPKLLESVEEDLADLLPEGWKVRIRPALDLGGKR